MSTDLKPGTRVQAILLDRNDDALADLPGMQGAVVPVSEWPVTLPDEWTDENTVIVRWDDPERLRFTPYRPDVAARVLRVLDDAPTAPPTGVVEVITQGISPFSPGTRGKVVEKPANAPEHDGLVRVQFDGGHDWYFLPRSLRSVPTDPSTPAQDHGPLAAVLSDRTLDKVLSRPTRVFGFNVVTISPQGIPGGPRLDGVVSRQRAQDELDELEPFMVDGWKTVMVELREVTS